jgi:hypothetical protein
MNPAKGVIMFSSGPYRKERQGFICTQILQGLEKDPRDKSLDVRVGHVLS